MAKSPSRSQLDWATSAPDLAAVQERFMQGILKGDTAVLAGIPPNSRTTTETLFGVYRNAYASRLVGVVESDHPHLKTMMGEDAFHALALAYIRANPSQTPNARWFSHALPEYIAASELYRDRRELAEMARLERALSDAFDAPDTVPAGIERLASIPPDDWDALTFEMHPAVQRLDFATNAYAIWVELKEERLPPVPEPLSGLQRMIVWRQGTIAKVREMGAEEAMMWDEAAKGVPFGALCELVAVFDDAETAALRAAQYLQGWLSSGMLADAHVAAPAPAPSHD